MLAYAEAHAQSHPECIGLSLHVREANTRARHLYETLDFDYGPEGVFIEDGWPTLEMRKCFGRR